MAAQLSREWCQLKYDEIRARFDGRGRVELSPGHATAAKRRRIEEIAHPLGYRLLAIQNLGRAGVRTRIAPPTAARVR
ncbi:hypothetical protein HEP87_48390 [Streptomyces sp. S1D4-11]|nr:hypothetical protein [Streptomyces sp. S1D4-11]QIZ00227.1 hypothetical protein HEP87_48390 [Streptomyces sp. S1D4-11]